MITRESKTAGLVSVVSAVYNGRRYLAESLESILRQEEVDLELIVVDDGSTDSSSEVLAELASRDRRVRVFRQEHRGLTRALIFGCAEARGLYIARHDADDRSLPSRLARQLAVLERCPEASVVACWAQAVGPEDEPLYEIRYSDEPRRADEGLIARGESPCHGSVMFRKQDYEAVGGYRSPFRLAQDLDLWLRLLSRGHVAYVPEVLYEWRIHDRAITASNRTVQESLGELARQCHRARLAGEDEAALLAKASQLSSTKHSPSAAATNAWFIGKCLLDRRDRRAIGYLWQSVRQSPLSARRWGAIVAAGLMCRTVGGPSNNEHTG